MDIESFYTELHDEIGYIVTVDVKNWVCKKEKNIWDVIKMIK